MTALKHDYYQIYNEGDSYTVKGHGQHPKHSVCYGQTRIVFLGNYDTEAEARAAFPQLPTDGSEWGNKFIDKDLTRMPSVAPAWFDPMDAGERWDGDY